MPNASVHVCVCTHERTYVGIEMDLGGDKWYMHLNRAIPIGNLMLRDVSPGPPRSAKA